MAGAAAAGLLLTCLQAIAKAALPDDLPGMRTGTTIYLTVSAVLQLAGLICYLWVIYPTVKALQQATVSSSLKGSPSSSSLLPLRDLRSLEGGPRK